MDNYYKLFNGSSGGSSKKSRHTSRRSSYNRRKQGAGIVEMIFKILFYILVVIALVFGVLILFSNNLIYETASEVEIKGYIEELAKTDRIPGTENEIRSAKYINDKLKEFGYQSNLDAFEIEPYDGSSFARNVVAIKEADDDFVTGDAIILCAHYDSEQGSVGANNNASGAAALLELANVMKEEKTDTKLIFLFTSGTNLNNRGLEWYLQNYAYKDKVIGAINIENIGIDTKLLLKIETSDLKHTTVSKIANDYAKRITKNELEVTYSPNGINQVLTKNKIPGFTITQRANNMYDGLSLDTPDRINTNNVKKVCDILENTLRTICKYSTTSLLEEAKGNNTYSNNVFVMTKDTEIPFGSTKEVVEEKMKFKGTFAGTDTNENKDVIDLYSYQMKWFNLEGEVTTKYEYVNSFLQSVKIEIGSLGMSLDTLLKQMSKSLELEYEYSKDVEGFLFKDTAGRKLYTLTSYEDEFNYSLVVTNYYTEDTIYSERNLNDAVSGKKESKEDEKLLKLISEILMPRDIKRVSKYITYTDGIGFTDGYCNPVDSLTNNSNFVFAIDTADVFDKDGNYINYKGTIERILKNYACILALNDSQVILTDKLVSEQIYMFTKGMYTETSYLRLFRNEFYKAAGSSQVVTKEVVNEETGETETVEEVVYVQSSKASGPEMMADFAKTFAEFILTKNSTDEKVVFFNQFEELVNIREYIRNNLGL